MSVLVYEQIYLKDEVIYNFGDPNISHLYFVEEGLLKVEAQVTIEQTFQFPTDKDTWEKQTKVYTVLYLIKELRPGSYFGLEELVKIANHRLDKEDHMIGEVKRLMKVSAV
jgi:CRP-like cAMP-binding protein